MKMVASSEEIGKETVSLAPTQPNLDKNDEVVNIIIKIKIYHVPLTKLVDSDAASSHKSEKDVKETKTPTQEPPETIPSSRLWQC